MGAYRPFQTWRKPKPSARAFSKAAAASWRPSPANAQRPGAHGAGAPGLQRVPWLSGWLVRGSFFNPPKILAFKPPEPGGPCRSPLKPSGQQCSHDAIRMSHPTVTTSPEKESSQSQGTPKNVFSQCFILIKYNILPRPQRRRWEDSP